jgi:Dolichyl-phosphate-mannose-protein mannosyltransferase
VTAVRPPTRVHWASHAPPSSRRESRRGPWLIGLVLVLAVAFVLRVWGVGHGLPYPYNPDELVHFVPKAVRFHDTGDFNPHYFVNPPGLSYVLYGVFAVRYGGSAGVVDAFARDTGDVYMTARLLVALFGVIGVWLLYLAGGRLFDRRVGLLAAAILAVSFLAVSWSHQAVNDVPTTAAVGLSLLGTAGVLRRGHKLDYALAGVGLGLACALKYTAGIVILPLLAAAALSFRQDRGGVRSGLLVAALATLATFVLFNPFSVLAPREFADQLLFLSVTPEGEEKLGQADENGVLYYLWVLTWGIGWVPLAAAVGGAAWAIFRDRGIAFLLVPAPVLYIIFMGIQERYFGRWLLPVLPIICLLAAYGTVRLLGFLAHGRSRIVGAVAAAAAVTALLAQSLVFDVHSNLVLSRTDTRNATRAWMVENVPPRTRVFFDRIVPRAWLRRTRPARWGGGRERRWRAYSLERALAAGQLVSPDVLAEGLTGEDFTRRLSPAVIDVLQQEEVCWVVTGSSAYGRVLAESDQAPEAMAFYERLAREAEVAYRASPYDPGADPVRFNFDWSSNYYPLAYHRPGPEMIVYRLRGAACGGVGNGRVPG